MNTELILNLTIVLLIGTYWILIWRINRLIIVLEQTKSTFKDIHQFFAKLKDNSSGLLHLLSDVADGQLHVESEKLGRLTIMLRKKEEKK